MSTNHSNKYSMFIFLSKRAPSQGQAREHPVKGEQKSTQLVTQIKGYKALTIWIT